MRFAIIKIQEFPIFSICLIIKISMSIKLYITDEGEENLKTFKYKGGSVGLSYEYIWSPFAQILVEYVPKWWAPNAITFVGFMLVILGEVVIYSTGKLGDTLSTAQLLIFAFLVFIYQTLDNIDGKQARRTGTSTGLGMLMDHGCDGMSCFLLANGVVRIVSVTDQKEAIFCTYTAMFVFFLSAWGQYYSNGVMNLGKVNAVDDGVPAVYCIALLTAFTGQQFWGREAFMGIARNTLFIYLFNLGAILQIIQLIVFPGKVLKSNLKRAFPDLIHAIMVFLSLYCITQFTDWYKVDRYYNYILFCLGFTMVRNTMYMQFCVVTKQKYNQFISANLVFSLAFPAYIFLRMKGIEIMPEDYFIKGMLVFFCINYLHFGICIWTQMADILGIKVFSIRSKPTKRKWLSKKTKFTQNKLKQKERLAKQSQQKDNKAD